MGDIFTRWRILGLLLLALASDMTVMWIHALNEMSVGNQILTTIFVLPLALTSAYLLLSKPRAKNSSTELPRKTEP